MSLAAPDPGVSRFPPAHLTAAVEATWTFLACDRGFYWDVHRIARYADVEPDAAREACDWLADNRIVDRAGGGTPGGAAYRMSIYRPLPWAAKENK